jgi:murein DD-endopeptidase MepM/ murein hydrolase activator NlpD
MANQVAIVSAGQGRFLWPVHGDIISGFGVTGVGRRNDGLDIRSPQGAVVHAAAAGDVVYAGNQVPGFGDLVLVKHSDGWVTAYAHLDKISVQMRQMVMQGQELGQVGTTGGVTEPQLHFEIRYAASPADKAKPLDPLLLLPK